MRLRPGRWLNAQMHLLSWLGEELHGESFLAEQRPQGRSVVVKVLHGDACRTPAYLERFRRCAERATLLVHRHSAQVHAHGVLSPSPEPGSGLGGLPAGGFDAPARPGASSGPPAPGIPWIATDPVEGPDLCSYLAEGLAPEALTALLTPIADLLDRAAALGLVHGELSPSSLILVREPHATPRLVLTDLGLAKVLATDLLELPAAPELLCYRSPEQCHNGQNVEPASDRYALAVLLFEAVAGRPPFVSESPRALMQLHTSAPVPPLRTLAPHVQRAEALDAFFVRALAKQPEARFPSAMAMMEEFACAVGLRRQGPGLPPQQRRSSRWYRLYRSADPSQSMDVVVGPRAVLGKQSECDVVCQALPSPEHDLVTSAISREHAVLIWLDNRLSVLDQSVNGTYVNERRVGARLSPLPIMGLAPGQPPTLRLGEHLTVQVSFLAGDGAMSGPPGAVLVRRDRFAATVPPTLMLWSQLNLPAAPLSSLGGAMRLGQVWVAQRELWWSGHPTVVWQRQDQSTVLGPAPLRAGDTLTHSDGVLRVEH